MNLQLAKTNDHSNYAGKPQDSMCLSNIHVFLFYLLLLLLIEMSCRKAVSIATFKDTFTSIYTIDLLAFAESRLKLTSSSGFSSSFFSVRPSFGGSSVNDVDCVVVVVVLSSLVNFPA